MRFILFILLQVVTIQLFAQKISNEFGEFSEEDINMTSYDKKPDAKAVVLYEKGYSAFQPTGNNFTIRFRQHKRIKIFDNAVADLAEIILPYYAPKGSEHKESYELIEAATWNNVNGKMV